MQTNDHNTCFSISLDVVPCYKYKRCQQQKIIQYLNITGLRGKLTKVVPRTSFMTLLEKNSTK